MLYSITTNDVTKYQGDINDVGDWVASLSPDQLPILEALANSITVSTEKYLGQPLGKRQIRFVLSRGETELNDTYYRNWLASGNSYNNSASFGINQWIKLPCKAESIQGVYISTFGDEGLIPLDSSEYSIDLISKQPRITFSFSQFIQDLFYKYNNLVIDFTGGLYEVDGTIPQSIDTAIKLQVKALFENRGDSTVDLENNGYRWLLAPYKLNEIVGSR